VHHRPLAIVSVLATGDYLLWNWSLQGNHDVLALVSGLTLPPLAIALVWLLALAAARLLASETRARRERRQQQQQQQQQQLQRPGLGQKQVRTRRMPHGQPQPLAPHEQHQGGEQVSSSSKLAA
jgi:hypothetical protein